MDILSCLIFIRKKLKIRVFGNFKGKNKTSGLWSKLIFSLITGRIRMNNMQREEAVTLLKEATGNKNLRKHSFAVEACMSKLAKKFRENEELWTQAGLLHDLDYDQTKDNFPQHGLITASILESKLIAPEIIESIKAHAGHFPRRSLMAKALYAVDPLSGLIVAAALMYPSKKLVDVDVQFVLNRFKEKHFAKGADRQQIEACSELGMTLEDFTQICLEAMQEISRELEL
ncbi:MAG: HDIG domain-containing metalloprotein [Candidatus Omnitrophota bacterium]